VNVALLPPTRSPDPVLAETLRSLRIERGLTQEAFAHEAGVTVGTVSRVEVGSGNPSWTTLQQFAQGLGMTTLELVERVEQKRADR
jgi:transcriptional regulator with XRE-family HTH domain